MDRNRNLLINAQRMGPPTNALLAGDTIRRPREPTWNAYPQSPSDRGITGWLIEQGAPPQVANQLGFAASLTPMGGAYDAGAMIGEGIDEENALLAGTGLSLAALAALPFAGRLRPAAGGNSATRSSRNASIFDPPDRPQRPFEADYPTSSGVRADAQGRLTHDIENRPLVARYVVGRREASGPDVALPREALDEIATARTGAPIQAVAPRSSELGGDLGRAVFGRGGDARGVYISNALGESQAYRVGGHEIGHVIDEAAGRIPTTGLSRELSQVYNTLNNSNRSRDGLEAATWGRPATPQGFGYRGGDAPREMMAEAIRAYTANPNYLKYVAPKVAARIREYVNNNPRLRDVVQFNALAPFTALPLATNGGGPDISGP